MAGERRAKGTLRFEPIDGADSIPKQISNHNGDGRR